MFNLIDMLIVRPIVNILFVTYNYIGDFGVAIIIFTIVVKCLTWPIMKKQLHQTKMMREIAPEVAEIKKNCKGNRQLESIQTMELYKRKNIKPFRSVLMVFIQLPIFIALFTAINVTVRPTTQELGGREYNVEHSAYSYVEKLDKIDEVIQLQRNYFAEQAKDKDNATYAFQPKLFGLVDLSVRPGFSNTSEIVILCFALFSAFLQYIVARQNDPTRSLNGKKKRTMKDLMREAAQGKEASQEDVTAVAQSQMTFMMPLMMLFIMISLPGAVVLYYMLTNMISTVQQKIILNHNYTELEASADKQILRELRKDQKIIEAQEAEIVQKDAKIARQARELKKSKTPSSHYTKKNKKTNKNVHITHISASDKKKRR